MLLTVDVGNSSTVLGIFDGDRLVRSWRLTTVRDATPDEVAALTLQLLAQAGVSPAGLHATVIAVVVPPLRAVWEEVAASHLQSSPLMLGPDVALGLRLEVDRPAEVGADRIADALAVWKIHGAPSIVVDCGTATTVDAVGTGGSYLGGAIAPGIGIAAEALFQRAALLHRVEMRPPAAALGTNTVSQVQSGIVYGCAAQIDGLVDRIAQEMGGADRVVATGGYCGLIGPVCRTVTLIDPLLTLHGLRLAHGIASTAPQKRAVQRPSGDARHNR